MPNEREKETQLQTEQMRFLYWLYYDNIRLGRDCQPAEGKNNDKLINIPNFSGLEGKHVTAAPSETCTVESVLLVG